MSQSVVPAAVVAAVFVPAAYVAAAVVAAAVVPAAVVAVAVVAAAVVRVAVVYHRAVGSYWFIHSDWRMMSWWNDGVPQVLVVHVEDRVNPLVFV